MKTQNKISISIIVLIMLIGVMQMASASFSVSSVTTSPNEISPGQTAEISLSVKNLGDDDYDNIKISLNLVNLPFSPYKMSAEKITDINSDESKQVSFNIIADAKAGSGIYKIPVQIINNGSLETSYISLVINAKPVMNVETENYAIKGENSKISLKIINLGLGNARFLTLKLQDVNGLRIISTKDIYIGDIDSNDYTTSEINLYVDSNAGSSVTIPIILSYKDALNKNYQEANQIELKLYSQKEAISLGLIKKSNSGMIVVIIIILIAGYFVYRTIRKRLSKKRSESA